MSSNEVTPDGSSKKRKVEVTQNQSEFFSSEDSSHSSYDNEPQKKKRKRVCLNTHLTEGVLFHFVNVPDDMLKSCQTQFIEEKDNNGLKDSHLHIYDANRVILKPTDKEKEEHRRKYREEYTKENYEKIKAYQNSEKVLKRREEYNKREDVKENKKKRAARRRKLLKEYKNKDPEFYEKFMEEI